MRGLSVSVVLAVSLTGCASHLQPGSRALEHPDRLTVLHVLNRMTFGPRPADADRVQAVGLGAYIASQLHPESLDDASLETRLAPLDALQVGSRAFAADYYLPMIAARQVFTNTQKAGAAALPRLGWHLLPIAAPSYTC